MVSGGSLFMADETNIITSFLKKSGVKIYKTKMHGSFFEFYVDIVAKPGSKLEKLSITPEGSFAIHVKQPPLDGKANEEIIAFISRSLRIPKSSLSIIAGETSKKKRLKLEYFFSGEKDINYYYKGWLKSLS